MTEEILKTKPIGRTLRLLGGVALLIIDLPVLLRASWTYTLASLGIVVALTLFYMMMHYLISRYTPTINRWLGALLALTPVFLVFIFGQGGGLLFGQGEGATGALTYIALSLLIDFVRADAGCEVMALPGLFFKNRTHLACITLTPIDILEEKLTRRA